MSEIFTAQQVSTESRYEFVVMHFGDKHPMVPYLSAFKIMNGVCMAAKHAMKFEGLRHHGWRDLAYIDLETVSFRAAREPRRSTLRSNVSNYHVDIERQLVVLVFETRGTHKALTVKMHFADAFQWYTDCRISARKAKAWAGDDKKAMRGSAHLTNAEDNDKFIYVR